MSELKFNMYSLLILGILGTILILLEVINK